MDPETKRLRAVLIERDRLRAKMLDSDRRLTAALHAWSGSRQPPERGGIATEAGARFLLGRAGLLPAAPSRELLSNESPETD